MVAMPIDDPIDAPMFSAPLAAERSDSAAATVTNEAAESDLSAASGALNMGASIGSSMGIATMSAVLSGAAATSNHPGAGAFSAAFLFGGAICAFGLFGALNLSREPSGPRTGGRAGQT